MTDQPRFDHAVSVNLSVKTDNLFPEEGEVKAALETALDSEEELAYEVYDTIDHEEDYVQEPEA